MARYAFYAVASFCMGMIAFATLGLVDVGKAPGAQLAPYLQVLALIVGLVSAPLFLAAGAGSRAPAPGQAGAREEEL